MLLAVDALVIAPRVVRAADALQVRFAGADELRPRLGKNGGNRLAGKGRSGRRLVSLLRLGEVAASIPMGFSVKAKNPLNEVARSSSELEVCLHDLEAS